MLLTKIMMKSKAPAKIKSKIPAFYLEACFLVMLKPDMLWKINGHTNDMEDNTAAVQVDVVNFIGTTFASFSFIS